MGQPQRAEPQQQAHSRHDDPLVSVQDWFDDEESGPWCVDSGAAIMVMRTCAIYDAVERGELSPDMKVWRDGRACWLPIAECYELTVKPPEKRAPTPVSGIRRVRPTTDFVEDPPPVDPPWSPPPRPSEHRSERPSAATRPTLMLTTSFAIGVVIGALLYLPFAW